MISEQAPSSTRRIRDRLAGQHLLVTGSTGFLAKAFVEKLLRSVDTIGGIHLLVRPKSGGASPRQRVHNDVLRSSVFDRLRAALGDGFSRLCEEKIHVVGGDLTRERLGLDGPSYAALARRITVVVNSAATVTFDERLDHAVELNTLGPSRLLQFAKDAGNLPFLHVSTCYVCGVRKGVVTEDWSAPEAARERLPRQRDTGAYDLDEFVTELVTEAAELRHRFAADPDVCRQELIDAGMRRARSLGWSDTYTFTKWIGEQLLLRDRGHVPLAVFRPAIIEGSHEEPTPGWIDGLRMADPMIVAYGRGKLQEFPARPDVPLDLIPVDFVANAMIVTLPVGDARRDAATVYQCGSSERHPFRVEEMIRAMEKAFRRRPMNDDEGRPIHPPRLRLVDSEKFVRKWSARRTRVAKLHSFVRALGITGRRSRRIAAALRQMDQLIYFSKIYAPYTHLDVRFADDALQEAAAQLDPADRELFRFDVSNVNWEDYIVNRHVPGLRAYVLGTGGEPSGRLRAISEIAERDASKAKEALHGLTLFEVFRRAAELHRDKPAFQVRRNARWVRYTYEEALHATGAITRRFRERGLDRGDRVAICAESSPEWALTYFAAMRAGLTTVPLDPQLPAREAWTSARFAGARMMCASATTAKGLGETRTAADAELVMMKEPFIPRPGASRDDMPEPAVLDDSAIASILFTSGTTVSPKAVQLSHRNLLSNARALVQVHPIDSTDELLSVLPLYHAFEFTGGLLVPVVSGATITYVDQMKGAELVAAMQATGTSVMLVVPRLLKMFHDSIESAVAERGFLARMYFRTLAILSEVTGRHFGRGLFRGVHRRFGGRLRLFVCGGSRLEPELFHAFERMGFTVCEGYGLTETAPVLAVNPPRIRRPGSVGPALPNVELEVRHPNLEGVGEIWAKGPSVMSGYLNNPEATNEVLVDGWFRTGDLGRLDSDGYLHLTGRSKDLIITGAGKNVYPDEVEVRYRDLPYAKEVCVFGMPAPDGLGDVVHAVVVVDAEISADLDRSSKEREIRLAAAAIGEELPPHQRIAELHFWDRDLPRTSTLKAKRGLIRDMVAAEMGGESSRASPAELVVADRAGAGVNGEALLGVQAVLSRQSGLPAEEIHVDSHLHLDLGIDSIGKMEAIGAIESKFDMRIDNDAGAKVARVTDLLRLIGDRRPKTPTGPSAGWRRRLERDGNGAAFDASLPPALLPMRWIVRGTVSALMNSYVRVRAVGRDNIPATGPFILAPNHSSHLDTPAALTAVAGRRRVWIAGAEDYFFNTAVKRLVFGKILDTIPFDRRSDGLAGLRRCAEALKRNDGLLIYPEGTRSLTGELQRFKIGVAVLAIERGVPIVPVHIDRTFDLLPKGRRFAKPGLVTVTFGQPIVPPAWETLTDHFAAFHALTDEVERVVSELSRGASV